MHLELLEFVSFHRVGEAVYRTDDDRGALSGGSKSYSRAEWTRERAVWQQGGEVLVGETRWEGQPRPLGNE